jgi:hypothetical protein
MKIAEVLKVDRVTPLNVEDALAEVRQCISETQDNLRNDREYIKQHPHAFGLTQVQSRRDEERSLLRSLRCREQSCLRLLSAS